MIKRELVTKRVHELVAMLGTGLLLIAVVFALFQTFWANNATRHLGYAQAGQYDLRIDKEITSGGLVFSGDTVSYQLEIFNADEGAGYSAANVEVVDLLPDGVELNVPSVTADVPPFFYTVSYDAGLRELTIIFDSLNDDELVTISYDALVTSTGVKKNVATISPESGAPAESVPEATGFCTPGHDPVANDFAVPGTNNTDCEQFTAQNAALPAECGADDIAQNGGTVFYGTTQPTQLCDEGSSSVPQNTVEIGKWTWTCISGATTADCEALNPHCGDTTLDTGIPGETDETCDDGNTTDLDGCSSLCQIEGCTNTSAYNYSGSAVVDDGSCLYCGDGIVQNAAETGGLAEECDDSNNTPNDGCSATCRTENVRFVDVQPQTDQVIIRNFGTEAVDVSSYRLCSEFSYTTGNGLQDLNVTAGSLVLAPGASVTVGGFAFDDVEADLALYEPIGSFASSDAMSDFLQRGGSGNGRESVADSKGIWTAGEFLDENAPFTYPGDGTTYGMSEWNDIPSVCGNGLEEVGEVCDDTNTTDGDGCSADCMTIEAGWECLVEGAACTDIDECTLMTDNCHINALCVNNDGGFTCDCSGGFAGDGVTTCDDIDECALSMDNCHADAQCTNTSGSFMCTCDFGYEGDGVTCTDIDECATGANNCDVNATCSNDPGSFSCTCNSGYAGPGDTCAEVCGDGVQTPGEDCDDNNLIAGDGCDGTCTWEIPTCDLDLSPTSGSLALTVNGIAQNTDSWELVSGWTWGDGATEPAGTTNASHTYFASGMRTVTVNLIHRDNGGLTASCENYVEAETNCGDGNLEYGEECDAGTSNGSVCSAPYDGTCTYCNNSCRIEIVTGSFCGDAVEDTVDGEQCDLGAGNNNGTCSAPYAGSCTACTATCTTVPFAGGYCGDGNQDIGYEQCDDGNSIDDDECQNDCYRGKISSGVGSSAAGVELVRNPRTDRSYLHGIAPDFMRNQGTQPEPTFVIPEHIKHAPMYTPGAYQYPTYTINKTGEFKKKSFKRSLQELLKVVPQVQRNNMIGIDESLPEEVIEPVVIEEAQEIEVLPVQPASILEEILPELVEPTEPERSVTLTPREELIALLQGMNKDKD